MKHTDQYFCAYTFTSTRTHTAGTIFLLSFSLVVVSYLVVGSVINHRRGEVGFDVIPQREFWGSMLRLIREGCLFSALTCVGGTKAAFKVGHGTYTRCVLYATH